MMALASEISNSVGLLGIAVAMVMPWRNRLWSILLLPIMAWLPMGDLPLAGYVRAVTGDLSMTTLVIILISGLSIDHGKETRTFLVIGALALLLYPMALGWGPFDPYRLGYGHTGFLAAALLLALLAWWKHHDVLALCFGLAALAWAVGLYESTNLWDYLIDPWSAIYAVGVLISRGFRPPAGALPQTPPRGLSPPGPRNNIEGEG